MLLFLLGGVLGRGVSKLKLKSWAGARVRELEARAEGSYEPPRIATVLAALSLLARDLAERNSAVDRQAARLLRALALLLQASKPDLEKVVGAAARQLEKAAGLPRSHGQAGFGAGSERLLRIVKWELDAPEFTPSDLAEIVCELALTDPAISRLLPFQGTLTQRRRQAEQAINDAIANSRTPRAEEIVTSLAAAAGFRRPSRLSAARAKRSKRRGADTD